MTTAELINDLKARRQGRVEAFEQAMLSTIVRTVGPAFSGLTLGNYMESTDFRQVALVALDQPLFTAAYEPAAVEARLNLINRIVGRPQ